MTCPKSQSESAVAGTVSTLFSVVTRVPHTRPDKEARRGVGVGAGNGSGTNNQQSEIMNKLVS